jgi:hypothetical protein
MRRAVLACAAVVAFAGTLATQAGATEDAAQELAQRFAPVVRLSLQEETCAKGEAFEPIDVRALFGNEEVALRGPWRDAAVVKVAPQARDLASGRHGYSLDFPGDALSSSACSYEEWQGRITAGRRPVVYAHIAEQAGDLALQYWLFYVYNDFNNKHEGDWEVIQLDFHATSAQAALAEDPFDVGYSQHEGGERAEWGDEKLELVDRTHPVVYPAEGSHADYFSGGLFLGRSAAEGVGCDDTNEPWRQLRPRVAFVPQSRSAMLARFPWLGYEGRWGERRRGFYDAPTGPNTTEQWTEPISWADAHWRSRSFELAGGHSLGPSATTFFCRAVGGGSSALIFLASRPMASGGVVALLVVLLLWFATRRRQWRGLVAGAARTYAANAGLFLSIGAIFIVLGVVISALQYVVFRRTGLSSLVDAFGARNALTEIVVVAFGFVVNLLGLTIVQAACANALAELSEQGRASAAAAYRATARRALPLLGGLVLASLAVAAASVTLIGLPLAIWLTIRWSLLAQAVALGDESATGSLRRSGRLVRGGWWRTASLTVFVTGIALLLGPLVGTLLLFATSASFDVVNLASDVVYVVALPFAAIATTYLYFDLAARSAVVRGSAASSA